MVARQTALSVEMERRIREELATGERILYTGRPDWRASWGWMVAGALFGLFWSAIALTFFGTALAGLSGYATIKSGSGSASTGLLVFILIFSLPFVAIGIAFLAAPIVGIRRSNNTVHVVTDQRVIDMCMNPTGQDSYPLSRINFLKRRDRRDGSGTLQIGYGVEKDSDGDPRPLTLDWTGIPNIKAAERAIREHAKWVR
jgi:hypothetical protein